MVTPDPEITQKLTNLPELNEKEYYQYMYDQALKAMLKNPTKENIDAFGVANTKLYEIEDAYRIGSRLLISFHIFRAKTSQKLHTL
jgi:hypothetical protein